MVGSSSTLSALVATALVSSSQGFAPVHNKPSSVATSTQLHFGIPSFLQPKKDDDGEKKEFDALPKKDLSLAGIVQPITAGAGAPFLGDYEGVDEETGNFMFSLEANNLVDENGNSKQTQMPHFIDGWIDPEDEKRAAEGFKFPWQK